MEEAANKAIAIEEGNAVAHYLLGKARKGQDDDLMTIAHLTKAITLKDDFIEARLLRAEALMNLKQYKNMMEDIDAVMDFLSAVTLGVTGNAAWKEKT